jgi:signal transduction histidine kinase
MAPQLREEFERIHRVVDGTIDVVQKISGELRHAQLDMLGLGPAIEWQLKEFAERTGLDVRIEAMEECPAAGETVNVSLLRILQEALTNVARHASATQVVVSLTCAHGLLTLTIRDNGRGITATDSANPHSLGLVGMRERTLLVGGTLDVSGGPSVGTTIRVVIPYDETQIARG